MKVWNAIFNLIAVMIIAFMILAIQKMDAVNDREFEQVRLSYAIDYATEAAFRATISTDSIGTDYANDGLKEVELNPAMAMPTFYNVLALSYDMTLGDDVKAKIESSVATGFICAINGYYILEPIEIDRDPYDHEIGGEYKLSFGVKRPYIVYANDPGLGRDRLFTINLVNDKNVEYIPEKHTNPDEANKEPLFERNDYDDTPLTKELVKQSISKWLTEDINIAINNRNITNIEGYKVNKTFYVPAADSMTAVNDIVSPCLAIIFQDSSFLNGYNMDAISIGGARVQPRSNVLGFKLPGDNTTYYCFAGQQLGDKFVTGQPKPAINIVKRYNTIHEAVLDGCHPHFMYLQEPYGRNFDGE